MNTAECKAKAISKLSAAKLRWNLLSQALKEGSSVVQNKSVSGSTRQFTCFGVLKLTAKTELVNNDELQLITNSNKEEKIKDEKGVWYDVLNVDNRCAIVEIRLLTECIPIKELILGMDNTGNICLWPSEEVLAFYCLRNGKLFEKKVICELGGGMTCLSGLIVAAATDAQKVLLTDGNERCINNFKDIVEKNVSKFGKTVVNCMQLVWGNNEQMNYLQNSIDIILCSDCIYFDNSRESLLTTIHTLLTENGFAIIMAPLRGNTYHEFLKLAKNQFRVEEQMTYDTHVWNLHEKYLKTLENVYIPDLHYPRMIILHRIV
ncbi:calmodulin-lysine N-methyltransferase-like protein [Leptotrombidium deliense]|uniref:Calmodulin-lysine N-methyltransferase n=1 Tax=Leptotrombidium deliense TaxID=299467 RepID=A0A443SRL4_9ACAR|nr:calmodulin-lysine N-methyltransferase-like protein [Leptotrombidium deliense]